MPVNPIDVQTAFLRDAILRISEKADSGTRSLLESFLPCASRGMVQFGEARFPVTMMPHSAYPERFIAETDSKYTIVCFYVANAIRALYTSVAMEKLRPEFISRVETLQQIADKGIAAFEICGTPQTGYSLELQNGETRQTPKQVDAGRGASADSPKPVHGRPSEGEAK